VLRSSPRVLPGQVLRGRRTLLQWKMLRRQSPLLQGPLPEVPAQDEEVREALVLREGRGVLRRSLLWQG